MMLPSEAYNELKERMNQQYDDIHLFRKRQ